MSKAVSPSAVDSVRTVLFKGTPVRVISADDELWFVASDVFRCLGVQNTTTAVQNLREDESRLIPIFGQRPVNALSERGLRKRLMRSKKPEACTLLDWVTQEAIPAHTERQAKPDAVQCLTTRVAELEQKVSVLAKNTQHVM